MPMRFVLISFFTFCLLGLTGYLFWPPVPPETPYIPRELWSIRSVDTMKYSRDLAREKQSSASFQEVIETQTAKIAATGATHIAIATPYDEEFLSYLNRWVAEARKNNLKVWFRGNLSGWEGWFQYPRVTRQEHLQGVVDFVTHNPDLFKDGDIFTPCPECENGGPGDPRMTGDIAGFRAFLIEEYETLSEVFKAHGVDISLSYSSMNYDVAHLIMDPQTTRALGGIVAIDHYTADPAKLARDVSMIARDSGGKVFLGEFGAPIPDIHGEMTAEAQAEWLRTAFALLAEEKDLLGLNYWVNEGGSTALWKDGIARPGVEVLHEFFTKKK